MEVRVPVGRNFSAVTRIPAAAQQAMNSSSLVIRVHQSTYPQMTNPKAVNGFLRGQEEERRGTETPDQRWGTFKEGRGKEKGRREGTGGWAIPELGWGYTRARVGLYQS
eukprot:2365250-Rhodomonas_salina.5